MTLLGDVELSAPALRTVRWDDSLVAISTDELTVSPLANPGEVEGTVLLNGSTPQAVNRLDWVVPYSEQADLDGDLRNTPLDALLVVQALQRPEAASEIYDLNGDGALGPVDALMVLQSIEGFSRGPDFGSASVAQGLWGGWTGEATEDVDERMSLSLAELVFADSSWSTWAV